MKTKLCTALSTLFLASIANAGTTVVFCSGIRSAPANVPYGKLETVNIKRRDALVSKGKVDVTLNYEIAGDRVADYNYWPTIVYDQSSVKISGVGETGSIKMNIDRLYRTGSLVLTAGSKTYKWTFKSCTEWVPF